MINDPVLEIDQNIFYFNHHYLLLTLLPCALLLFPTWCLPFLLLATPSVSAACSSLDVWLSMGISSVSADMSPKEGDTYPFSTHQLLTAPSQAMLEFSLTWPCPGNHSCCESMYTTSLLISRSLYFNSFPPHSSTLIFLVMVL